MRYLFIALLAAISLVAFVPTAVAQQKTVREELPPDMQKKWDAARSFVSDDNWADARLEYRQIFEATKNPRVLFNAAICWKELEHYWKALAVWEEQLTYRDKMEEADIKRSEQAIEVVKPFVSQIEIKINEPDVTLFIDGIEAGKSPFIGAIPIDTGQPKLRFEKEKFETLEKVVTVAAGITAKANIEVIKQGRPTSVTVNIEGAPKAMIIIDSVERGDAPWSGELPAGRHTFKAEAEGYEKTEQTSILVYGVPFVVTLRLVKKQEQGKVKIVTGFEDAVIEIDGKTVGSGAWEGNLEIGGHRLVVRKDGYEEYVEELSLSLNQEREIRVKMKPERDNAWIYWMITGIAVATGVGVGSFFVFQAAETSQVTGTLNPGVVTTSISF